MTTLPVWARYLAEAVRLAPSADNSQPWRLTFENGRLTVAFDAERGTGLGRSHPAVLLAFGTVLENLITAAGHAGISTEDWRFHDFPADARLVTIPAPEKAIETVTIPETIRQRHTNRAPFKTTPPPEALVTELTGLHQGNIICAVFHRRQDIRNWGRCIRMASKLRFRIEEVHRWLAASLRFTPEEAARGDGLDIDTLALPPGGKTLSRILADWRRMDFLNRFGAYRLLAVIEAAQFTKAGAVVLLSGNEMTPRNWLDAGRLMERVWLRLTAWGWAVQPYFVVPDQIHRLTNDLLPTPLRSEAELLATEVSRYLGNYLPLMCLRIGQAGKDVPRTIRLPLTSILKVMTIPIDR